MTKVNSLLIALAGVGLTVLIGVSPAQAWMEQSQSQKVEQSVTAEVSGSGTAKVESTQKAEQSQSQKMNSWSNRGYYHHGYVRYYDQTVDDGQVYLSWGMRGGTCHVRYTENANRSYKYSTSAACDDGGITIGGLRPGWTYRFQIKQDNGAWSRPVRIKAS